MVVYRAARSAWGNGEGNGIVAGRYFYFAVLVILWAYGVIGVSMALAGCLSDDMNFINIGNSANRIYQRGNSPGATSGGGSGGGDNGADKFGGQIGWHAYCTTYYECHFGFSGLSLTSDEYRILLATYVTQIVAVAMFAAMGALWMALRCCMRVDARADRWIMPHKVMYGLTLALYLITLVVVDGAFLTALYLVVFAKYQITWISPSTAFHAFLWTGIAAQILFLFAIAFKSFYELYSNPAPRLAPAFVPQDNVAAARTAGIAEGRRQAAAAAAAT